MRRARVGVVDAHLDGGNTTSTLPSSLYCFRGGARDRESVSSVSVTLFSILDLRPLALERASESSLRSCWVTRSTLRFLSQSNRGALETKPDGENEGSYKLGFSSSVADRREGLQRGGVLVCSNAVISPCYRSPGSPACTRCPSGAGGMSPRPLLHLEPAPLAVFVATPPTSLHPGQGCANGPT